MSDTVETIKYHLLRWSGVVIFLLLWKAGPQLGWIDPYFVPPFSAVVNEIGKQFSGGYLAIHVLVSVWRAVVGLLLAFLIALPLGFLLGRWLTGTAESLSPILRILSQVNPFSLMPVFVLFFGIGETAKIAMVGWVSLWPILFYTMTGVRNVDPILVKTAASMGVSWKELTQKILLPAALPTIFVGIRIGATITFYILVAAEMLGASAGLGYLVHNSAMNYQIPRIYAGATFIVILGYLLNRLLIHLERVLFVWQEEYSFTSRPVKETKSAWQLNRLTAAVAGATLLLILVYGGLEVHKVNREAANASTEPGSHSRHFGTPVDSNGF